MEGTLHGKPFSRTSFDFSMDDIKVVELLSKTEGNQNLFGKVVKNKDNILRPPTISLQLHFTGKLFKN